MWLCTALVFASVAEQYVPAPPGSVLRAPRPVMLAAPTPSLHSPSAAAARTDAVRLQLQELEEPAAGTQSIEDADEAVAVAESEEAEEEAEEEEAEDVEEEEEDAAPSIEDADEESVAAAVDAFEAAKTAAALPEPERLSASAEASLAAALISALAVLGIDIASFGVVENLELVVAAAALALSQVDSAGPVGATLRTVGGATSAVVTKGILPAAKAVNNFVEEKELGLYTRALLEIGLEELIIRARGALDPGRREAEEAEKAARRAAAKAAAEAAERQARRDALPFWDLEKYKSD